MATVQHEHDVLIVDSGAAGLTAALTLATRVLVLVQQHRYAIEDLTTREPDLEDVFVQLTTSNG